jgi:exodeoxyribonuclease VII large subunit
VTGIGHEVDKSIADLVADYHAHTPTEAAQVVTQNWRGMAEYLAEMQVRQDRALRGLVVDARQRLSHVCRHEFFRRPMDQVNTLRQVLDDRERQLRSALQARIWNMRRSLVRIEEAVSAHNPAVRLAQLRQRMDSARQRLGYAAAVYSERRRARLESLERELRAVSPESVLRRGYSLTTLKKSGVVVRSVQQIRGSEIVMTRLADGTFESIAEDPKQPTLFK